MKLRWHEEARVEADAAAAFYNDKQPGLAQRFIDNLKGSLSRKRIAEPHTTPPPSLPPGGGHSTQMLGDALPLRGNLSGAIRCHRDRCRDAPATGAGILEVENLKQVHMRAYADQNM